MRHEFDLKRPLVVFDLETTGTSLNDRIVEISLAKLLPGGEVEITTRRINPERHIPEEATAVHGISDEDVANEPTFAAKASALLLYLEGCDLSGFNVKRFDIPLLEEEFKRVGLKFDLTGRLIVDMQTIFHKKEPRTLSAAYKFYCGKDLENAHSAEADVVASIEVLQGQLDKYPDLPRSMEELHAFCDRKEENWIDSSGKFRWMEGVPSLAFSKHSGRTIRDIATNEPGFFKWMLRGTFPADTKQIAQDALQGIFPPDKKKKQEK